MNCSCGSQQSYADCCEPYILGKRLAPTPETLMRSRYTAYVKCLMPYLRETLVPSARTEFNENDARHWAEKSEWLGLEILSARGEKVEFIAKYKSDGKVFEYHEVSRFKKLGERWFFVGGESHLHEEGEAHHHHKPRAPTVRETPKVGRNEPCPCGSGKKFKKCCGGA